MKSEGVAHTSGPLVGTWKLVSVTSTTLSGERDEAPYGAKPNGILTYTDDGRVSAMTSFDGRKPLPVAARVEQQAEAFKTFLAYAGRYRLSGDTVTHSVEIASIQNWVDQDLVRKVKFEGDRITLITPPTPSNGKMQIFELVWQRLQLP
jgi:hypothetical protein